MCRVCRIFVKSRTVPCGVGHRLAYNKCRPAKARPGAMSTPAPATEQPTVSMWQGAGPPPPKSTARTGPVVMMCSFFVFVCS